MKADFREGPFPQRWLNWSWPARTSAQEKRFHRYHRVLSRATWSSRKVSRLLLGLLLGAFVPEDAPLVVGIDEILQRRYAKKISAPGASTATLGALYPRYLR